MADRPIIFGGPMIRALIDGRKTQTRRVLTPGTCTVLGSRVTAKSPAWTGLKLDRAVARTKCPMTGVPRPHLGAPWVHPEDEANGMEADAIYRIDPIIEIGDRLWVREAHQISASGGHPNWRAEHVVYAADDACIELNPAVPYVGSCDIGLRGWHPSIQMPRWASRLTLLVIAVRVQRLQDISEDDARAEGLTAAPGGWWSGAEGQAGTTPRAAYGVLWNSLHGPDAWNENPWVAAITFEVRRANIDALPSTQPASPVPTPAASQEAPRP